MTNQPYIVGKFYRVPCVLARAMDCIESSWWVVLGPWHEDSAIVRFDEHHFHPDWRFANNRQWGDPVRPHRRFATVITQIESGVEMKRRRCRRDYDPYPFRVAPWLKDLNAAFADKTLTNGICPHRGADLNSFTPDADGCVTCPLHGLRWDAETGKCRPPELPETRRDAFRQAVAARLSQTQQGAQQ